MDAMINGRTPEEIKTALKVCPEVVIDDCPLCPYTLSFTCRDNVMLDALALIERLESERDAALAKVPMVHAEWILKHIGVGHYWQCSACHTNPCIYVTENTKFCPNCGARMDGEADV